MGCCLSAGKVTAPPVLTAKSPPTVEEETVKEVLVQSVSVSVPVPVPVSVPVPISVPIPISVPELVPSASIVSDTEPNHPPSLQTPEISHNKSDICSVSHSFSTATTATAASILEDDALSKPYRPPTRRNRPERVSRSPGERQSPQGKLRPRLARERQLVQPNPIHNRRNVDSGPLQRSRLQDGPSRRSRSPATRGPSSARRSPMKKREGAPEDKDKLKKEEEAKSAVSVNQEAKEAVSVKKDEEKVADEVKNEDESVKEPEVSMECFIFL